ncbi:MAG: alpha-glucan family phosphorylase [Chthoniobacteraceae bacterium]|nr:alpha-glucan family phosphorylase [Chthoniobacteraceae bacterium]
MNKSRSVVAYFSMEVGIETRVPTYSGGLGILAGDTIRAAADMKVPMVAVTLLHRKGYFYQRLNAEGWQTEEPVAWVPEDFLMELPGRATVQIEGRPVQIRAWVSEITGAGGFLVLVYFLDTDLPENSEWDRHLTDSLYGGDSRYRLCQEVVLGIGGVRMLRALGYRAIARYHMNEGHAALLGLELLDEEAKKAGRPTFNKDDIETVKRLCVFTTHTPVPAGHDQFPVDLINRVLERREVEEMKEFFCCDGMVNMTYLALNLSHYINGVAKKHGEVAQHMFARYTIDAITNGVHGATWASDAFASLFDRHIPGWRQDNFSLRYALNIPKEQVWLAHHTAKLELLRYVNRETNAGMDGDVFTIGFARRATAYKRPELLFSDVERLKRIAGNRRIQIVFAGKAHPNDQDGREIIHRIFEVGKNLKQEIPVTFLEHYDMEIARLMVAGVDLWLNTPQPPMEASGTSGMKAALNGVPSLSILDGWWIEGCIEGLTGWAIGGLPKEGDGPRTNDAAILYDQLEKTILPLYYEEQDKYVDIMRHSIALNGSFFNTHRMIQQYVLKAYFE